MDEKKSKFVIDRLSSPQTRAEAGTDISSIESYDYIDCLYTGIKIRISFTDTEGSTSWFNIFSIVKCCISGREYLTVANTEALCRILTDRQRATTTEAETLMVKVADG